MRVPVYGFWVQQGGREKVRAFRRENCLQIEDGEDRVRPVDS
ncbi:hypothetical protein SLEP1_g55919 [Rubroshorea leprosula]|uniref:Uncharacterized protein n=1 Tax=Rubroshorea leprosula TaxID=152421 RepID=A0AAV5MI38_9ROSI|nr:hypothetical protein SLEP1_g55919 [Rubroshorea leprosula]